MAKEALAEFIPQTPDQITAEWLTSTLGDGTARVTGFTTGTPGSGVGFSGITTKLTIDWDAKESTLPSEVLAKFPTDMAHRGLTEQEGGYEREIWFYEGLGRDMPVRIPVCHHAEMDPGQPQEKRRKSAHRMNRTPAPIARFAAKRITKLVRATKRRYVVLIEYIADARVTPLDKTVPRADLEAMMRVLAKIHARYWRDHRLPSDPATSYDTASQNFKFLQAGYDLWVDDFFDRTPGLEDQHRVVMDWAQANLDQVLVRLNEPYTLLHGDARSDNMLFLDDGGLVVIDFGTISSGPPGWDVAYAMSAAVEPGVDARTTLDALADVYHHALVAEGVTDYSRETLGNDIDVVLCFLGHRQVLTAMVMEGGYDTDGAGETANLGDLWMRKIIDLLPKEIPILETDHGPC
ncbi:MAG: aminoglycoside phosphotransferase family protein [Acidimicrobiales bacterium]|jgi:thiamine kinase-like enzyme|nr:aminoglycoside phosphotransferase family protein [Acidimicrobiales bacterium]